MWEFVRKNTFAALAFTSYGAFWLSFYAHREVRNSRRRRGHSGDFLVGLDNLHAVHDHRRHQDEQRGPDRVRLAVDYLHFPDNWKLGHAGHVDIVRTGGWTGIATAVAAWYASCAGVTNCHVRQNCASGWSTRLT